MAAEDPFAGVEELIVTGSNTDDLLNPTSSSAITFDPADLANVGIYDVGDLDAYVPNLEISSANSTNASFFVRGVGLQDFGANASSSVPIFQDGIPRNPSATQLTGLFDVAGISVLKGPQGSGNHRNASAGAIIARTNAPNESHSGMARTTLSRLASVDARDAHRYQFETFVNAPVYEDRVLARVSARYSHENPFWENRCANRIPIAARGPTDNLCGELRTFMGSRVTPFIRRYLGEVDDYAIRAQFRIKSPDSKLDWTFRGEVSHLNREQTAGQFLGTGAFSIAGGDRGGYRDRDVTNRIAELAAELRRRDGSLTQSASNLLALSATAKELLKHPGDRHPFTGDIDSPGRTLLETHSFSTTGVVELAALRLNVDLGFIDYRKSEIRDNDLSPNVKFSGGSDDQAWEYYGDLSLEGDALANQPIAWETGVYTLLEKVEAFTGQSVQSTGQETRYAQEIFSAGAYAQASWAFREGFELSGGLRYNWEQKDFGIRGGITNEVPGFGSVRTPVGPSRNQRTWDGVTGFARLEYRFTEDVRASLKYTRGFKAGHFNPSNARDAKSPGESFADPEHIDAVEWDLDASFWAGRAKLSGAFFFYRYDSYQVFRFTTGFTGLLRVVQNAKQARNFGA